MQRIQFATVVLTMALCSALHAADSAQELVTAAVCGAAEKQTGDSLVCSVE
jgi:hypothetical protein